MRPSALAGQRRTDLNCALVIDRADDALGQAELSKASSACPPTAEKKEYAAAFPTLLQLIKLGGGANLP